MAQELQNMSDSPPTLDISVKISSLLKNPNSQIFTSKTHPHENRFDFQKVKQDNSSRQPVLFEQVTEIHLTHRKYVITSFVNFDDYYTGFKQLEKFANKLLAEITK